MAAVRAANLGVRFLTELFALAALAYGSWQVFDGVFRIVPAVGLPLVAAIVWGLFVAPKARTRLDDPLRLAAEAAVFGPAVAVLFAADATQLAIVFAILIMTNVSLMFSSTSDNCEGTVPSGDGPFIF